MSFNKQFLPDIYSPSFAGMVAAVLLCGGTAMAQEDESPVEPAAAETTAADAVDGEADEAAEVPALEGDATAGEDVEGDIEGDVEGDIEGDIEGDVEGLTEVDDPSPDADAAEGDGDGDVEEIVITGSRIGRNNLDEYAHISVVSSEEISLSGTNSIDDLLNKMPSLTLQGTNKQANNGGRGLAFVDLRNLGSGRTLVLINNRRFVSASPGGGVDMNNIPVHMIERVEVLLDGASAVYGSDAIGGVVNVILKKDYEGIRADLSAGISGQGDGGEISVSTTMGGNHDHGNVSLNFTYFRRNEVRQWDRAWARGLVTGEVWEDEDKKNKIQQIGSLIAPTGYVIVPPPDADTPVEFATFKKDGKKDFTLHDGDKHYYDYGQEQYLMGRVERFAITALGTYELSEFATAYLESNFTHRNSLNQMAGQPAGNGTASFPGLIQVPFSNPHVPEDFYEYYTERLPGSQSFGMLYRFADLGNRQWKTNVNTFRLVTGLKGYLFNNDYTWDIFASYGKNRALTEFRNSVNLMRLSHSVDPDICAMYTSVGCAVYDGFGLDTTSEEVKKYIRANEQSSTEWTMTDIGASIAGRLFDLPGGQAAAVLGGEARWESGFSHPDSIVVSKESAGNISDPTAGGYSAQEAFAEVTFPFVRGITGVDSLTLDLAGRFSRYDTFGSELTYRAGMSWGPIPDIKLRGIYSTAFRAPSISDLYGGSADSYATVDDPCAGWEEKDNKNLKKNCEKEGVPEGFVPLGTQIRTEFGSNPNLIAERARVINAGIVLTPTFLPKSIITSITADYYNILLDKGITNLVPQQIVNTCYESKNMDHEYCEFVGSRTSSDNISGLKATAFNIGEIRTSGMDFTASVNFPVSILRVLLGWNGNYLLSYEELSTSDDDIQEDNDDSERAGTMSRTGGTYTHWRWNVQAALMGQGWRWHNTLRFIGGAEIYQTDPDIHPTTSVPAVFYLDTSASYIYKDLSLVFGVSNLLDEAPPRVPMTGQNANVATYDAIGRYFHGSVGYQF